MGCGGAGFGSGARPGKGALERRTRSNHNSSKGRQLGFKSRDPAVSYSEVLINRYMGRKLYCHCIEPKEDEKTQSISL